jgi:hypothetical protein
MWIEIAKQQPKPGQPIIAGWTAAPWYRKPMPDVGLVPYVLYDQGEEGLIWCEWQGGEFPIGEECDWDVQDFPTHWMAWPEPPNAELPCQYSLRVLRTCGPANAALSGWPGKDETEATK